jgi:carboxypeptidase Taq
MGSLFFSKAVNLHPEIPAEMAQGKFETLHTWLVENIYQHGRKFTANELIERVTGGPLTIDPYIAYLKSKYGELYKL